VLDRLCAPLCDAVVGDDAGDGQELLEELDRANLFLVPLDDERVWYRYHHLFADMLRARLVRETANAETAALHRRRAPGSPAASAPRGDPARARDRSTRRCGGVAGEA
jgi:LuxR family maltose regulon positive regulatory protein